MDGKDQIKPTARKYRISHHLPEEEVIEISVSLTTASALYVCVLKGVMTVQQEFENMKIIRNELQKDPIKNQKDIASINNNMQLAADANKEGVRMIKELGQVIKELDETPKSKIIIPPASFKVDK